MTMDVWGREGTAAHGGQIWKLAGLVSLVLGLALLLTGCGAAAPTVSPLGGPGTLTTTSAGEQAWALEVLHLTNLERAAYGIPALELDEAASNAAYAHAWDMDLRSYFDHVNPDGEGPPERLARHGVDFSYVGENIARGQVTPAEVVKAWMDSPSHRVNMLSEFWTHIGIGVHSGTERGPWWAQEFLRR